jgi:hypothetical protein
MSPLERAIALTATEESAYATAYNSAKARHPDWPWLDPRLFRLPEPRGPQGAGRRPRRSQARAEGHREGDAPQGLIGSSWADGPTDGLGAICGRVERRGGGTAGWGGSGPGG